MEKEKTSFSVYMQDLLVREEGRDVRGEEFQWERVLVRTLEAAKEVCGVFHPSRPASPSPAVRPSSLEGKAHWLEVPQTCQHGRWTDP